MPLSDQVLSGQITANGWLELVLKLVLVLLLIYVAVWLLQKRLFPFQISGALPVASPLIRTLAIHPLSPGVSLYLVEVEKRRLLLSVSAQHPAQLVLDLSATSETTPEHG